MSVLKLPMNSPLPRGVMATPPTRAAGPAADDRPDIEIRPVRTRDDYDACVDLQRDTWGQAFSEVVPVSMMQITAKMGGVATGAFGPAGELLGLVYGMTGLRRGELAHWSHMLAVRPEARNQGIGKRLKFAQRDELRAAGVVTMYWTFDPLVARNAHLNLNLLGAAVDEFVPDMYGVSDSELHQLGTDRFIVRWDLRGGAGEAGRAFAPGPAPRRCEPCAVVRPGGGVPELKDDVKVVEVLIPKDIETVEARCFDEAVRWRHSTRHAFSRLLTGPYDVTQFIAGEEHGRYVISRIPG